MKQMMFKVALTLLLLALVGLVLAQPMGAFRNLGVDSSNASIPLDRVLSGGPPPQGIPALGFSGDWKDVATSNRVFDNTVSIKNEGVWEYDPNKGTLLFTPDSFLDTDPTPLKYKLIEKTSKLTVNGQAVVKYADLNLLQAITFNTLIPDDLSVQGVDFTFENTMVELLGDAEVPFVSFEDADGWLADIEPVIVMSLNGENKAYPLQILTWHEIVNDTVGGVPVAVTFCPLCNSALAFDRRIPLNADEQDAVTSLNDAVSLDDLDDDFKAAYSLQEGQMADGLKALEITLGVSGMLYNSNMLMFDTATSTLWSQLLGVGAVGTLNENQLLRYPAQIIGYGEFKEAFPEGEVLSRETGYGRQYGVNPYVGYDDVDAPAFLFDGEIDGRLTPKERVITLVGTTEDVAYPFTVLSEARAVNDSFDNNPVTLFWKEGTSSALDARSIADAKDIGAVGVFSSEVDGQVLDFSWDGDNFVDDQTGSTWNIFGHATSGDLEGTQLRALVHDNTLWFSWAAFKPETRIFAE